MRTTPYHAGEHVADAGLGPESAACPACGSEAPRTRVHTIQSQPDVALLRCDGCGIASASRMPTPDTLDAYYGRYYDPDRPKLTFAGMDRFARHLADVASASVADRHLRLLDFGGGDGSIAIQTALRWCDRGRGRSAELTLVDYEAPASSPDPRVTVRGVRTLDALPSDARFDTIIASAILEHVPEVGATMQTLYEHLDAGGTLYARTPYWEPLLRVFRNADLTFPGHVHDMGAPFWSQCVATMGWDATLRWSRPSIVETSLRTDPVRTLAAWLLKAPAHLETRLRGPSPRPIWRWVGGWEVCVQRRRPSAPA
jgi:SAM-dependent methyltransferase